MSVKEKRNSDFFLRPRFSIDIQENQVELLERITSFLKRGDCKYSCRVVDEHIFIDVPANKSHFWSPQLHLEVLKEVNNTSKIKGLFAPKPQVWTLFVFIHFIVAFLFLGFGVMLYVRYTLGESLVFPIAMLIALPLIWLLLYFLGRVGKQTGKKQMKELHDLLIDIIDN
jgi:Na+/melibiose symporter-like transporter